MVVVAAVISVAAIAAKPRRMDDEPHVARPHPHTDHADAVT
jgi:hypothetical protein